MILPPFELHRPGSLAELLDLLRRLRREAQGFDFVAGGTDVLPKYKNRLNPEPHLISLSGLPDMAGISPEEIGALARISDLARHPALHRHLPGLVEAARRVSSPSLRNLGTLGGNLLLDTRCFFFNQSEFWREARGLCLKAGGGECLVVPQEETCYATYSGDLAPVLLVLGACLVLHGASGERRVPIRDFYRFDGFRRFDKAPEEVLTSVRIPPPARELRTGYRKLRARDTIEYPVMGVALGLTVEEGRVERLEVAVTGSEAVPLWYGDLGLSGRPADEETARALMEALRLRIRAYRNVPLPPSYRKAMGGELAHGLFLALVRA